MKSIIILAAVLAAGLSTTAQATQYVFVAMDNTPETKMCVSAGSNDRDALRLQLNQSSYGTARYNANTVLCNGKSLAQFAHQYGADQTHTYLIPLTRERLRYNERVIIRDISYAAPQAEPGKVYVMVSSN
ncbi:DUF3718 domain-containing protein [Shewanella cyperi]|uniref:DUF3718 domain-containing protein n=1 Tax=Shewanella cyperi TaxID=2814292 RepID=A0A974XIW6_9GAMM|nr:DUF3718 domain-containing protein [Shewanella cyperi]QSX29242.1 DUF3718 domain-containing protein [Shewanella cyperi]